MGISAKSAILYFKWLSYAFLTVTPIMVFILFGSFNSSLHLLE
jgi:hypothetical protein